MEYRLNKYISASGYCSRREADRFIESGNVTINGKRASITDKVMPGQQVRVNGNLVNVNIAPVYLAFNKPQGIVSTSNLKERNNIIDFIKHEQKIFPIGQLDSEAQGLVLLTNDANTANKIINAGSKYMKVYVVYVNKPINDLLTEYITQGMSIDGLKQKRYKSEFEVINQYTFKITIFDESNREIQRICDHFGYEIQKLECIQIMNIKLDKIGQGNHRNLTTNELSVLLDTIKNISSNSSAKEKVNTNTHNKKNPKTSEKKYSADKQDLKVENKNKKASNTIKGPREGKSKIKSLKDKTRRWYQ